MDKVTKEIVRPRYALPFHKRVRLGRKLKEHLANLDKVDEALKVAPENEELHKLKEDLGVVIRLVAQQILGKKDPNQTKPPNPTSDNKSQHDAMFNKSAITIPVVVKDLKDPSATTIKHVNLEDAASTIPNLPPYFYNNFEKIFGPLPPGPEDTQGEGGNTEPSTSTEGDKDADKNETQGGSGEGQTVNDKGSGEGDKQNEGDGNKGPHSFRKNPLPSYTQEQKQYANRKRKFNNKRNAKIKKFLETNSIVMVNGEVRIETTPCPYVRTAK